MPLHSSLTTLTCASPPRHHTDRVDEFLDEGAFLGTNKLVREQLRIVAGCSTLVELLHNSRKSLTVAQVGARGGLLA